LLNLRILLPPTLTMMHVRIMLYTHWSPLFTIMIRLRFFNRFSCVVCYSQRDPDICVCM